MWDKFVLGGLLGPVTTKPSAVGPGVMEEWESGQLGRSLALSWLSGVTLGGLPDLPVCCGLELLGSVRDALDKAMRPLERALEQARGTIRSCYHYCWCL